MSRIWAAIQRANAWVQMQGTAKAVILMYHRIASPELDPWGLSVAPHNFADHLDVIRQQAQPMSLQQLAAAQRDGNVPNRAVAITFDDGYADNLHSAKPLLESKSVSATVFVTTGHLGSEREFWWDELERVLLQPGTLPETLSLNFNGQLKHWQLGAASHYSLDEYHRDRNRRAWEGQPNSRLAFYYSVWGSLRTLPTEQRQRLQDEILEWANANSQARSEYRSLTVDELLELERGGFIEVGGHTKTHPSLPAHSLETQREEIYSSKKKLEQLLNHSIQSFAYPFGDFNRNSMQAAQESGFNQACSTVQQPVWRGSDRFQLPRFEAQNWPKAVFEQKLNQWLQ